LVADESAQQPELEIRLFFTDERVQELVGQDREFWGLDAGEFVDVTTSSAVTASLTSWLMAVSISTAPDPPRPESGFRILRIPARTSAKSRASSRMASASSREPQSAYALASART